MSERIPDKKKPRLVTPEELASAPKTQALMVELIDRPEKAAEKVKGEVPQLQAGITALFEALSECGIHAASLERELATAKRQACTSEHRTICSFASSATDATDPGDWQCRDYGDGWITFPTRKAAEKYQQDTGAMMRYRRFYPPVAVSDGGTDK